MEEKGWGRVKILLSSVGKPFASFIGKSCAYLRSGSLGGGVKVFSHSFPTPPGKEIFFTKLVLNEVKDN